MSLRHELLALRRRRELKVPGISSLGGSGVGRTLATPAELGLASSLSPLSQSHAAAGSSSISVGSSRKEAVRELVPGVDGMVPAQNLVFPS